MFDIAFFEDWNENWPFPVLWPLCWVFQMYWHNDCSSLTASCFRIWNSSAGILSPPLALFIVIIPKAHLSSYSRMSGSRLCIILYIFGNSKKIFFQILGNSMLRAVLFMLTGGTKFSFIIFPSTILFPWKIKSPFFLVLQRMLLSIMQYYH